MADNRPSGAVLVTGGTGFVGSHVVLQLLEAGYTVHAAVRPGKTDVLKSYYPQEYCSEKQLLKIFEVTDLESGDFKESLKGVSSLLHIAAPILSKGHAPDVILEGAIKGTFNVINQAVEAGVKKIVYTSTYATLFDPDLTGAYAPNKLDGNSWGKATSESLLSTPAESLNPMQAYMIAKTIAEKQVWKFADEHPDVDFTTILPPAVYGPTVPLFPRPSELIGLGTSANVAKLITNSDRTVYPLNFVGHIIDVRDLARAHVLALSRTTPTPPLNKKKRIIVASSPFSHSWKEVADAIRLAKPELTPRLPDKEKAKEVVKVVDAELDLSIAKEVLGMSWERKGDFRKWEETVVDSIEEALKWEEGETKK